MNPVTIGDATLYTGDALETLCALPDRSVQTCITSPPYYGLRDYAHADQIGLESSPDEYVAKMVQVFREVRRVLRDDATLWLNLGDSYAAQRGGTHQPAETLAGGVGGKQINGERVNRDRHDGYNPTRNASAIGLKHKDMCGIPWRVAFALQADGWYLRQDIIWAKPNPMPESVKDRCTKAHEYIFLLSKSAQYYFDADAIAEQSVYSGITGMDETGYKDAQMFNGKHAAKQRPLVDRVGSMAYSIGSGRNEGNCESSQLRLPVSTRNRRSVWTVATQPFSGAHFATFPPDLIRPCVMAGCPSGGVVLDPFSGSGTTGMVALQEGRKYIGIELNPDYQKLAVERITPAADQPRLIA